MHRRCHCGRSKHLYDVTFAPSKDNTVLHKCSGKIDDNPTKTNAIDIHIVNIRNTNPAICHDTINSSSSDSANSQYYPSPSHVSPPHYPPLPHSPSPPHSLHPLPHPSPSPSSQSAPSTAAASQSSPSSSPAHKTPPTYSYPPAASTSSPPPTLSTRLDILPRWRAGRGI